MRSCCEECLIAASWVGDSTWVVRSGARAGAAVVVLGLSLAAPQAMRVARADGGSGGGGAASAGSATPSVLACPVGNLLGSEL